MAPSDPDRPATATRREALIGASALALSSGAGAPPAAAAPIGPAAPPAPPTPDVQGDCTPFRRVYLQK